MAINEYNNAELNMGSYLTPKESRTVLSSLEAEDHITHMARQRMISADVLAPSVVITTSKKLVVVIRTMGGLKSHIKVILYKDIGAVRIAHGILVSSIYISMKNTSKRQSRRLKMKRVKGR